MGREERELREWKIFKKYRVYSVRKWEEGRKREFSERIIFKNNEKHLRIFCVRKRGKEEGIQ